MGRMLTSPAQGQLLTSSVGFSVGGCMSAPVSYELTHLQALDAEAMHIIREVAAEFERPVLLFSGGKDSAGTLHLAAKAFAPARLPVPVMHVDTGRNFPGVLGFRNRRIAARGARLSGPTVQ